MSNLTTLSVNKEKKRPSVSSKCLLNIKSIVAQNVSVNSNNKHVSLRSSTAILPPLPLEVVKESTKHVDNRKNSEEKNRNKSQEYIAKIDSKKSSNKQIDTTNGHHDESIQIPQVQGHQELQSTSMPLVSKESNSEQYSPQILTNNEFSIIPPLPLSSSMYPFGSSTSSPHKKPLLSFPVQSSNRINEDYVTRMHHIIASSSSSSNNPEETKPIELSIYRHPSIPIHRFDSASPTISTIDDDEDEDINLNGPLIFVNSSLNLPIDSNNSPTVPDQTVSFKTRLSERSEREYHTHRQVMNNPNQYHPRYPTNYTRLPHSLRQTNFSFNHPLQFEGLRSPTIRNPSIRRQFPQFESVRTPIEKSPPTKQASPLTIPAEVFDCCQTETITTQRSSIQRNSQRQLTTIENNFNASEVRSNYFRDVSKIREIMMNASKRLTQDLDSASTLPIVDTHCHFDLIFDRLRIKHNNLTKYFNDYSEYYPSGLTFQLAIQVFWRPKQLTEESWVKWYSKYLDDERVYGSCGIHPHWSSAWTETSADDIERCLQHPKIVAIGEIGLDFGPKNLCLVHEQRRAFEAQLKLAAKWLKPIVIHSRDAYEETFKLMKQHLQSDHKIHLHCFVGTIDDVYLFTSYFTEIKFGFTPIITRYNFLHSVIQQLDLTQILSETDSPYFTPEELSTYSRCAHPGMVYSVVEMISQLRQLPVFDVAYQLRENARHMYGV